MDSTVQVKVVPFYDKNGNVEATVTVSITAEGKKVLSASAGYKLYPMNAEGINVKERGWDPDLIRNPLIGDTRHRCYMIPVPEGMYQPLMAMEWAEAQRNTRKRRCRIPAENGGTKICRDRSCYGCPMTSKDHITSETVSLDAMMENSNMEAFIEDVTSAEAMKSLEEEEFIAYLKQHDPKCAQVYKKDKIGFTTAEIASFLGVTDRMIRYYKNKIDTLRKQFEAE
jgi:hypothetical protein